MTKRTTKLLSDVLDSINAILGFVADTTFEEYDRDELKKAAVERKIEIMGEALKQLRDCDPAIFERVPDGNDIIGTRNRLMHGYNEVDHDLLWSTIELDFPKLSDSLHALIEV